MAWTTLEILMADNNEPAREVVWDAVLFGPQASRAEALAWLLKQPDFPSLQRLTQNWPRLSDPLRAVAAPSFEHHDSWLRSAYQSSDPQIRSNALEIIRFIGAYRLLTTLVSDLTRDPPVPADLGSRLGDLVLKLGQRLHDALQRKPPAPESASVQRKLSELIRKHLDKKIPYRDTLLSLYTMIAVEDDWELRQIVAKPTHPAHGAVLSILSRRREPEIIDRLFHLANVDRCPQAILKILAERGDVPFLNHTLDKMDRLLEAPKIRASLRFVKDMAWMASHDPTFFDLSENRQAAGVRWVSESATDPNAKMEWLTSVLDVGKPAARSAAVVGLARLSHQAIDAILDACLDDEDPAVQSLALLQLKQRRRPDLLRPLVARLDSTEPQVRQAAQQALGDYSFAGYLASFDKLDRKSQHEIGALILKIDANSVATLKTELRSARRRSRAKAIRAARLLQLVDIVYDEILRLAMPDDLMLRYEATEALIEARAPGLLHKLALWLNESSPTLREAGRYMVEQLASRSLIPSIRSTCGDWLAGKPTTEPAAI